jgi:YD repeat-containing protein
MTKPRPIEAMPKPGFDQKGWSYRYQWVEEEYRVELTDPQGQRYWVRDRFPTMAAAFAWIKKFVAEEIPFAELPGSIERAPSP